MVGVGGVVLLNVSTLFSLALLPVGASLGTHALLWDAVAALCSVGPVAFSVRILLRRCPHAKTLYGAVSATGGPTTGAFIVLCEWVSAVTFTPPLLQFVANACFLAFECVAGCPDIAESEAALSGAMLAAAVAGQMVLITAVQWHGVEAVLRWLRLLLILGSVPMLALAAGAAVHAETLSLPPVGKWLRPEASGVVFGFAGIEVSAFHLREAPAEACAAALGGSVALVLGLYAAGQLLLAALVAPSDLSLSNGTFQALRAAVAPHDAAFAVTCALSALGGLASTLPWLIGPVRGLAELVGQPERPLVLAQNFLVAALGWVFLCTSAAAGFWWFTAAAAAAAQAMYIAIFYAAWRAKERGWDDVIVVVGMVTSVAGVLLILRAPQDVSVPAAPFAAAIVVLLAVVGLFAAVFARRLPPLLLGEACSSEDSQE